MEFWPSIMALALCAPSGLAWASAGEGGAVTASVAATSSVAADWAPADFAPAADLAPEDDAPAEWWSPLTFTASLDVSVGVGTFVRSRYADDPYYASTLSLSPGWRLTDDLTLGLSFGVDVEWTGLVTPCRAPTGPRPAGAPAEDCSGPNDPNGRAADVHDLSLSIAHGHLYELAGAVLSARGAVALPTSRASRAATNVLALGVSARVERPLGPLTPSLDVGFDKYFPVDDAPLADPGEGGIPIGRCRGLRDSSCLLLAGFVPSWRLGVDVAVSAELPGGFDASVSFGYAYTGSFGRPVDARSSPVVDADGARVVDGVGASDTTHGSVELGYAVGEALRVSVGVASAQPARTADNAALRFPFFDFLSPANNYSAWYAAVSWTPL